MHGSKIFYKFLLLPPMAPRGLMFINSTLCSQSKFCRKPKLTTLFFSQSSWYIIYPRHMFCLGI